MAGDWFFICGQTNDSRLAAGRALCRWMEEAMQVSTQEPIRIHRRRSAGEPEPIKAYITGGGCLYCTDCAAECGIDASNAAPVWGQNSVYDDDICDTCLGPIPAWCQLRRDGGTV